MSTHNESVDVGCHAYLMRKLSVFRQYYFQQFMYMCGSCFSFMFELDCTIKRNIYIRMHDELCKNVHLLELLLWVFK